ncbi:RING-type E3 ubiquitin transferase [Trifolium repens]|nr:RING-type E3 ubiquitin transferase [Trifolium repens]
MYNTCNYESTLDHSDEDLECAVCLCKIEDEDEIRVLRCNHMYHKHCLDKWIGFKNHTCPLCRESLRPKNVITELGVEVLSFNFCAIRRDRYLALFSSQVGLPSAVDDAGSRRWFDVVGFVEGVLDIVFAAVVLWSVLWNWVG